MPLRLLLRLLLALAVPFSLLPAAALAADEDEDEGGGEDDGGDLDDLDDGEPETDDEVDDERTYKDYLTELEGESAAEELDAWQRYLEVYPKSLYRLEIEKRMKALEDAAFEELAQKKKEAKTSGGGEEVDAKRREMDFREPALLSMSPNTRRHVEASILWGYPDVLNGEVGLEWAFIRQFSAFGKVRNTGKGFGGTLQLGAKYALVKDVRSGIVLSGAFSLLAGYNQFDRLHLLIEPWIGFGFMPVKQFQLQTSLAFDVRVDRLHTALIWDLQFVVSPNDVFGIYVENRQKHSLYRHEGLGSQYLGFHQAGVGVKLRPTPMAEITIGVNVPYAWRLWQDYRYLGIHGGLLFYLPGKKE